MINSRDISDKKEAILIDIKNRTMELGKYFIKAVDYGIPKRYIDNMIELLDSIEYIKVMNPLPEKYIVSLYNKFGIKKTWK